MVAGRAANHKRQQRKNQRRDVCQHVSRVGKQRQRVGEEPANRLCEHVEERERQHGSEAPAVAAVTVGVILLVCFGHAAILVLGSAGFLPAMASH